MATTVQERIVDVVGLDMPVEEDTLNCAWKLLGLRHAYPSPPVDPTEEMPHDTDAYGMLLLVKAAAFVENGFNDKHMDSLHKNEGSVHNWLHNSSGPTEPLDTPGSRGGEGSAPSSQTFCSTGNCSGATHCVTHGCSQRAGTGCPSTSQPEGFAVGPSRCPEDCPYFDPNATEPDLDDYQGSFEHTDTGRWEQPLDYRESPVAEPSVPDTKLGKALASDLGPRWAPPRSGKRASRKPRRFDE
jgi:hypothetical protein